MGIFSDPGGRFKNIDELSNLRAHEITYPFINLNGCTFEV